MQAIPLRICIEIVLSFSGHFLVMANIGILSHESLNNDHQSLNKQPPSTPTSTATILKSYENDTIILSCNYKNPIDRLRWLKDNREIISANKVEEIYIENYQLFTNGSLMVNNLQPEDTGVYSCEILADNRYEIVEKFAIEVQYSPRILIEPNGIVEAEIGATVEIICETFGVPTPIINWLHNEQIMTNDFHDTNRQNRLIVVESRNLSGTIECTASNGIPPTAKNGITLLVLFPPEVRTSQHTIYTKLEYRVQIECFVESAPTARIYWYHNGEEINSNAYYALEVREALSNTTNSRYYSNLQHILTIRRVRTSNMGQYKCRAENRLGEQSALIQLTFRPMPCILKTNPIMSSPTSHLLIWQTESYSSIIEFQLKFRQLLSSEPITQWTQWTHVTIPAEISIGPIYTASFRLHGLQSASIYQAVVFARNQYGWSDTSDILQFTTKNDIEDFMEIQIPVNDSTVSNSMDSNNTIKASLIDLNSNSANTFPAYNASVDPNDFIEEPALDAKKILHASIYALSHSNHKRFHNSFSIIILILFHYIVLYLI